MNIQGFENSSYYLINPIWLEITGVEGSLDLIVTISGAMFEFRYYPRNNDLLIDVANIIRNAIPNIQNKQNIIGQMDGSWNVNLRFEDDQDVKELNKLFVLGGKDRFENNLPANTNLNITNYFWAGYPHWNSRINSQGIIENTEIQGDPKYRIYPRHDCDHAMIIFRNLKGGFSKYLFESFTVPESNKSLGYYFSEHRIKTSGVETKVNLSVSSKIKREFYETITQLGKSIEIYWYDDGKLRRLSGNNNIEFDYKKPVTEVNMEFELVTNANKIL